MEKLVGVVRRQPTSDLVLYASKLDRKERVGGEFYKVMLYNCDGM